MALSASILTQLMISQCAARSLVGIEDPAFCKGVSEGIVLSFLAMNKVTTTDVGIIAVGAGIGKMSGLSASILTSLLQAQFAARGVQGIQMPSLASAIANAVCMHFLAANIVNTVSAGIAIGTGVGKVSALISTTMANAIKGKLMSYNIRGILVPMVSDAIGNAVCNHIMSMAIVNVTITGGPVLVSGSPVPGGGVGNGKVS